MRNRKIRITGWLAALTLLLTACTVNTTTDTTTRSSADTSAGARVETVGLASNALVEFDACDEFLDYVISHAVEMVGPYGLNGNTPWRVFGPDVALEESADTAATAPGGDDGAQFSGTNVQVEGVDEPDMVKTDGDQIVLIAEGQLIVVDVTGDEPEETGRMRLDDLAVQSLFLSGDTVLMFGSAWSAHPMPLIESDAAFAPVPQSPTLQLVEVDISGDPEVVRTMTIDGQLISGRMVEDTVRLVMTSGPVGFEWSYPEGSGLRAEREAVEENREIIRNSEPENWIPYYIVTDSDGDVVDEGILFDCERASHPEDFSGLNMLSVLTLDIDEGLAPIDATGVLATGSTVYASTESLYVATQSWQMWEWARNADEEQPEGVTTDIHKFDTSEPEIAEYVASGSVTGYLLNQFAMDEHDGLLRVASTTRPNWWGSDSESESMVTVLEEDSGELAEVGSVDGLGETEQIYSVRFMEDTAYVVTFRQTDPLYVIDLSDPTRPFAEGELKILGYSAYLHPVGEGLLMGIGQDATEQGRVQGTQVSIFDVSDPSDPTRVDTYTLSEGSNSQVEYDHHAFLYWHPERLAVIPVQQWRWDDSKEEAFFGAIGLEVGEDGQLDEVDRIVHPGGDKGDWDWRAQIMRSIVIEDSLYTVSSKGIMKSSLDALEEQAWLDF